MPVVFEKLAAQLRDPPFRTSESGYDSDDVRAVLDEAAARLSLLEERVAKAEARAEKSDQRLVRARRFARSGRVGGAATEVLDEVVREGQQRADAVVAEAHAEVERLRAAAVSAVEAARARADDPELRAEVEAQRAALQHLLDQCRAAEADLGMVEQAVVVHRDDLLAGLDLDLRELADMPFPILKEALA